MTKSTIAVVGKAAGAWLDRRQGRARVRRELSTSSDRALADMGLARGDIDAVVEGTYRHR